MLQQPYDRQAAGTRKHLCVIQLETEREVREREREKERRVGARTDGRKDTHSTTLDTKDLCSVGRTQPIHRTAAASTSSLLGRDVVKASKAKVGGSRSLAQSVDWRVVRDHQHDVLCPWSVPCTARRGRIKLGKSSPGRNELALVIPRLGVGECP